MKLVAEFHSTKQKALIITKQNGHFVQLLKHKLKTFDIQVFLSPQVPESIVQYTTCIFVDEIDIVLDEYIKNTEKKCIFILFNKPKESRTLSSFIEEHHVKHIKIINLESSAAYYKDDIETIFWFAFSRSDEIYLHIYHPPPAQKPLHQKPKKLPKEPLSFRIKQFLEFKRLFTIFFIAAFFVHLLFIPPLLLTTYLNIQSATDFRNKKIDESNRYLWYSTKTLAITDSLYKISRPTLLLFSLAFIPDDLMQLNKSMNSILVTAHSMYEDSKPFVAGLFLKNKTTAEQQKMSEEITKLKSNYQKITSEVDILTEKIPEWNKPLKELKEKLIFTALTLKPVKQILPHTDSLMAKDGTKVYLLLFANNMELRPGGGFIGSFGLLTVKNYTIEGIKIYDVYDADGQLKEHVDPPIAIATFLNQPHWFLRDSAFSPDFYENYLQAKFFLEKELNINELDGAVLLTTSSIQNLLEATGDLYVPDFKETVNKDNFYIKTQMYAENKFFPGSLQKKSFLTSLMNQMIVQLETTSPLKLFEAVKKSFDEKQMVIYVNDPAVQDTFDTLYWSGRTLKPKCAQDNVANCIVDYLFTVDANLGVNKANFFITKPSSLDITIDEQGKVSHTLTINYKNSSYIDIFPGGRYRNYLQLLLPLDTVVQQITQNDTLIEKYDERNEEYKIIGFMSEVPPQQSKQIKIKYTLPRAIGKGNGIYQLILQKQIGSSNSDFKLSIHLPDNIIVANKNFSPLVKGNDIIYNTTIVSDKIFIIEFFRE